MKILIAPDSFKGTMTNRIAAQTIAEALNETFPGAETRLCPMADGGEGTARTLTEANGGTIHTLTVKGPLGGKVTASFGVSGDKRTAFLEMASASGIELVPAEQLNPLKATTYGTGELLREIARLGIPDVIMGIGGSATVDGGAGMAQALGYRLLDADGNDLPEGAASLTKLASLDASGVPDDVKKLNIHVACDVTNPLLGSNGAAAVYGPQKGATPVMIPGLEKGLGNLAAVCKASGLIASCEEPGDGAAGGLGMGLRAFCQAEITSGARLVSEAAGFDAALPECDLVITGEGRTDSQTASGKICAVLAEKAHEAGVPIILIAGALLGEPRELEKTFDAVFSTTPGIIPLKEALENSRRDLAAVARSIGKVLSVRI